MIRRSVWAINVFVGLMAVAQQPKSSTALHAVLELPAILQEGVVAGKTPVGAPVHSKLMIATLINGVVIPQDAVLLGRIEESTAKTKSDPSRLKIRLEAAQWKGGSIRINAFLTNMYYANRLVESRGSESVPDPSTSSDLMLIHGGRERLDGTDLESRRAAWSRQAAGSSPADEAHSSEIARWETSIYRKPLPNVDVSRDANGAAFLLSRRDNIKLERNIAYCFESR